MATSSGHRFSLGRAAFRSLVRSLSPTARTSRAEAWALLRRGRGTSVDATEMDERRVAEQRTGADFVVHVYEGESAPGSSWSVSSYLLHRANLGEVADWLSETLPQDAWAVGVVLDGSTPAAGPDLHVAWIVGDDVLNTDPASRSETEQRVAVEMVARRGRVDLW